MNAVGKTLQGCQGIDQWISLKQNKKNPLTCLFTFPVKHRLCGGDIRFQIILGHSVCVLLFLGHLPCPLMKGSLLWIHDTCSTSTGESAALYCSSDLWLLDVFTWQVRQMFMHHRVVHTSHDVGWVATLVHIANSYGSCLNQNCVCNPTLLLTKEHFPEFHDPFETDWRFKTAVLNLSSDLWPLDMYTWQVRQMLRPSVQIKGCNFAHICWP